MPPRWRSGPLLLLAALLALLFVVKQWDPDVWWHLATGRFVVEHGAIPRTDPFSFTRGGAPWATVDWLADLALYGAFAGGGSLGLGLVAALLAWLMLLSLGLTLRELDVSRAVALATVSCTALLVQVRYAMCRPLIFGAAFSSLGLYLVARAWTRRDRSAWGLVPLVGVWSLVHPSVLLGLVEAGALAAATLLLRRRAAGHALGAALGSAALAALLGRGMLLHAVDVSAAPLALQLTLEWQRATPTDVRLLVPGLLLVAALVAAAPGWRRLLPLVLIAVAGALAGARFVRSSYEATLLGAPLVGVAAQALVVAWPGRRRALVLALGLLVPLVHIALGPMRNFDAALGPGFDLRYAPVQTLAALRSLPPGRTLHDCTLGGYLIWQRVPVYCDGRLVAVYDNAAVDELLLPLYQGGAALEAVADRYDVRYGLARFDSDLERALMRSPDWLPVAYDDGTSLFVRRSKAAGLEAETAPELRYLPDAAWLDRWYGAVLGDPARRARLDAELTAAVARCPSSPTLRAVLVYLDRAQPAYAEALKRRLEAVIRR